MATFRWLDRLRTSMDAQPEVSAQYMGLPLSVNLVADSRALTSRETFPRATFGDAQGNPSSGLHRVWRFRTLAPGIWSWGLHRLSATNNVVLLFAPEPAGQVYNAGPTALPFFLGDAALLSTVAEVATSTVATANLPTAVWSWPALPSLGQQIEWSELPFVSESDSVLMWNSTAAAAQPAFGVMAAIRR